MSGSFDVVLLTGVIVGAGAAGAVVTKDVEQGVTMAGIPARYVRDVD